MKNIYILPEIFDENDTTTQHIYIVSDDELVLGGYHFNSKYGDEPQKTDERDIKSRKYWEDDAYIIQRIVLTSDPKLIDDGVQEITDEFFEWHSSDKTRDYVEIHKTQICTYCGGEHCDNRDCRGYNDEDFFLAIIPELVQTKVVTMFDGFELSTEFVNYVKKISNSEDISKAAIEWYNTKKFSSAYPASIQSFIEGAKYQQENMFAEDRVKEIARAAFGFYRRNDLDDDELEEEFEKWLDKLKK